MSKWCGNENCLQCADKEPDPYVHLPREKYQALRDERDRLRSALEDACLTYAVHGEQPPEKWLAALTPAGGQG